MTGMSKHFGVHRNGILTNAFAHTTYLYTVQTVQATHFNAKLNITLCLLYFGIRSNRL